MGVSNNYTSSSSLKCELRIVGAKNIETKHKGALFIRCYLPTGNSRRIQLNTRELMSSKKNDYVFWDDSFSLECNGADSSIHELKEENIVFELRWRNTKLNFLGNAGSSKVLARSELPWKNVLDAQNMEIQSWIFLTTTAQTEKLEEYIKPPALQVGIKVELPAVLTTIPVEEMKRRRRRQRLKNWDECGCTHNEGCSSCVDNELLLIATAFEGF